MGFLGPVTGLDGHLVRPHDLDLSRTPVAGGVEAVVTRIVSLGFEIRVEARAGDTEVWAQLTGVGARALDVQPGDTLYFRPAAHANSLTAAAV